MVYRQFGLHPEKANNKFTVRSFREKVLRELKKIKIAWPELNYATEPGVLVLYPSAPAIAPSQQLSLEGIPLKTYIQAQSPPLTPLQAATYPFLGAGATETSFWSLLGDRHCEVYTQIAVIWASFPRLKRVTKTPTFSA